MFLEYGLTVEETLVELYVNVFKTMIRGIKWSVIAHVTRGHICIMKEKEEFA